MTVLHPMSAEAFADYRIGAIRGFAEDNVASGRWPAEGALARSEADFEDSLPKGLDTPDNHLFEIRTSESGPTVGYLWFAVVERHGLCSAFVNDLEVLPEYRRQGHAEAAFQAMEPIVRGLGLTRIDLHVFAHNEGAQALYRKLGYGVTGMNMRKDLAEVDDAG